MSDDRPQFDPVKYKAYLDSKWEKVLNDAEYQAAMICYYYHQYTLEEAARLEDGDRSLLPKTAMKIQTEDYIMLLTVYAAAQHEKGYRELMRNLKDKLREFE